MTGLWLVFVVLSSIVFTWYVLRQRRKKHIQSLLESPFSDTQIQLLRDNLPLYRKLPSSLQHELHGHINVFLSEKLFVGVAGLTITDEIKLTIAGQACMLLLGRKTNYFSRHTTILVYPNAYRGTQIHYEGMLEIETEYKGLGESWYRGPVVLSWDDVKRGVFDVSDGHNVVLHEFAHQLDQEDSAMNGAPLLLQQSQYISWARVLSEEYKALQQKIKKGEATVIDQYGATHPAEFFAVATEAFFEKPQQLKNKHEQLYEELKQFYHLDPAAWA
ncbi:MAG: zinc-dependent peptidase [Gammaproteobacteria bacterium]|nr:zinc-dependent peptidase [Gammaproteobacteria bacterium]